VSNNTRLGELQACEFELMRIKEVIRDSITRVENDSSFTLGRTIQHITDYLALSSPEVSCMFGWILQEITRREYINEQYHKTPAFQ
jgi:hypothetical protein